MKVLVDEAGVARSSREAPEIDGIIEVPTTSTVGEFHTVRIVDAMGSGPRGRIELMPVDPSAVKTWANLVTVARVLIAPFMFVLIPDEPGGSWVAFALWFVLCSSDGIDGYLARRHGTTTVGAFLDPLADKVLVLGAMFFLVSSDVFWIVPVVIIAARELAISLYRTFVGAQGRQRAGQQDRQVEDARRSSCRSASPSRR